MRIRVRTAVAGVAAGALVVGAVLWASARPSNDRTWIPEQAVLPVVTLTDSTATVRHLRNFRYPAPDSLLVRYEDRTYDLRQIERVWYVLSPFTLSWRGPAHTFLSFSFADSQYVSISVEARRELGESYSMVGGTFRKFELMYVIGDERDLIPLRVTTWHVPVYLYPARATPAQARAIFVHMLRRARQIERRPEFYHSISNNCITNIVDAVDEVRDEPVPYGFPVFMPGYSDELARELGLLDTDLPLEQARARYLLDPAVVAAAAEAPDFSTRIRASAGGAPAAGAPSRPRTGG